VLSVPIDVPLVLTTKITVLVVLLTEKESMLVTVKMVSMKMLLMKNVNHVHTTVELVPMPKLVLLVMKTSTEDQKLLTVHVSMDISKMPT
jgi:uncharacterized protein YqfB (UPF0267 family)